LAEWLGMSAVLIPPAPGVLCAEGLLGADLRAEFSRTMPDPDKWHLGQSLLKELEAAASTWFDDEGVPQADRSLSVVALLRYAGQGAEIAVPWSVDRDTLCARFSEAHRVLNGFVLESPIELVTLRVEASGRSVAAPHPALPPGNGARPVQQQPVWFGTECEDVPLYDRDALGQGDQMAGPAIVTQRDCTTLVRPGWYARVLTHGGLLLHRDTAP
jgi:N-methylhydantoinase A